MKTFVYSRYEFKHYLDTYKDMNMGTLPRNTAYIEIEDQFVPFYFDEDDHNIIRLRFDDAESNEPRCMTEEQAEQLIDFIEDNIGSDFIIHCAAGQSRSAAIQRFIVDSYQGYREGTIKHFANWHVVTTLKRKLRERDYGKD